jgi:hypothetical protein
MAKANNYVTHLGIIWTHFAHVLAYRRLNLSIVGSTGPPTGDIPFYEMVANSC